MDRGGTCLWLLAALTALLLVAQAGVAVADFNVTLLHSQDGYGSVVPLDVANRPCPPLNTAPYYLPSKNSSGQCLGGLARRSGVADAVRKEVGGNVLLIDAGDALMGSLFYSMFGSEVIATYYAYMGYDAVKLEGHDFTSGVSQVALFTRLLANTTFVVSSNIVNLNDDSRFVAAADGAQVLPFALIQLDGRQVGFVGTMRKGVNSMFGDPGLIDSTYELVAMRNTVAYLQNRGINKIIASVSGVSVVEAIVNEVPGIDVLIVLSQLYGTNLTTPTAGPYPTVRRLPWQQPLLIVGTGVNNGKYLGRLDLVFDDYGVIQSWNGAPILLDDSSPVDLVMQADIVRRQQVVDGQQNSTVVGSTEIELAYQNRCVFGECTIGAWSVDAMRAIGATQIAFAPGATMNGSIQAGNITWDQLCDALPLQNAELVTYSLKGQYLWAAMENSVSLVTNTTLALTGTGVGRFLQVSGMRVRYNENEQVGMRIVEIYIEISSGVWRPLNLQQYYTITSFPWVSVLGMDGYVMIKDNLEDLLYTGLTGTAVWLTALGTVPITAVPMGRLNTTSVSRRTCYAPDGQLCSGKGICVMGACVCTAKGTTGPLCAVDSGSGSGSLSAASIAGIVIAAAAAAACILAMAIVVTALLVSAKRRPAPQEWLIDFDELEIGDLLGCGGYGEVYRGKWKGTGVAVKTIKSTHITREMRRRFVGETSIMSRLRHPNVVLFMAASTKPPLLCIVMEYMALGSLYDLLHNDLVTDIPFPLKLKLMYQAAKGMHFLHSSGVAHRDLKSLNLLLDNKWNVKVADFGLTVFWDSTKRKGDGVVGSVPWMAPELLMREDGLDYLAVDVYAFGIILWEVLTRKRPYEGLSGSQVAVAVIKNDLRPILPSAFDLADPQRQYLALTSRCWHRDPTIRPAFQDIMGALIKISNQDGGGKSSSGNVFSSSSGGRRARTPASVTLTTRAQSQSDASASNSEEYDRRAPPETMVALAKLRIDTRVPRYDVSFVVCDLARFDRVWQRNPGAADRAIRVYGRLVRQRVQEFGGHVFSKPSLHSGGTFLVTFTDQSAAASFGLMLQSDVASEAGAQRGEELRRHSRVGITHRPGLCAAPSDDRTRTTYELRDYAKLLRMVARCRPGSVVCSRGFHGRYEKARLESTEDIASSMQHDQGIRFARREDELVRVLWDTAEEDEEEEEEDEDDDEDGDEGGECGVCSSDKCPWIIDTESIELGESIGEGTFGQVLEGVYNDRRVAVKRLFNSRLDDDGMRKLRKEAAILSGVDHPNVVKLMGLSVSDRSLLLVMELVPRGSLRGLLSHHSVQLRWRLRLAMLRDAAVGLAFLHSRGIVHRDIKSSNLLVDDDMSVKVADFGFATVKQDDCTMTRCGSPSWTAPEVLAPVFATTESGHGRDGGTEGADDEASPNYDEKADVYSFGIVMWEVLTRRVPYEDGNLTTVAMDVLQGKRPPVPQDCPDEYRDVMRRCWHEKPHKRPAMDDILIFFTSLLQLQDLPPVKVQLKSL